MTEHNEAQTCTREQLPYQEIKAPDMEQAETMTDPESGFLVTSMFRFADMLVRIQRYIHEGKPLGQYTRLAWSNAFRFRDEFSKDARVLVMAQNIRTTLQLYNRGKYSIFEPTTDDMFADDWVEIVNPKDRRVSARRGDDRRRCH